MGQLWHTSEITSDLCHLVSIINPCGRAITRPQLPHWGTTHLLLMGVDPFIVMVQGWWKSAAFLDYWHLCEEIIPTFIGFSHTSKASILSSMASFKHRLIHAMWFMGVCLFIMMLPLCCLPPPPFLHASLCDFPAGAIGPFTCTFIAITDPLIYSAHIYLPIP